MKPRRSDGSYAKGRWVRPPRATEAWKRNGAQRTQLPRSLFTAN
jgi:hypothetical protein